MLKVNLEKNRIISSAIQPRTECKNYEEIIRKEKIMRQLQRKIQEENK